MNDSERLSDLARRRRVLRLKKAFLAFVLFCLAATAIVCLVSMVGNRGGSKASFSTAKESFQALADASQVEMNYHIIALTKRASIVANGQECGTIIKSILSWGSEYIMHTSQAKGEPGFAFGKLHRRVISLTITGDVFDEAGALIATAKAPVRIGLGHKFNIYNPGGKLIGSAFAIKYPLARLSIKFSDVAGQEVALATKSYFLPNFKIQFFSNSLDKRVVLSVVALEKEKRDEEAEERRRDNRNHD